jgi:hypothetical protein
VDPVDLFQNRQKDPQDPQMRSSFPQGFPQVNLTLNPRKISAFQKVFHFSTGPTTTTRDISWIYRIIEKVKGANDAWASLARQS